MIDLMRKPNNHVFLLSLIEAMVTGKSREQFADEWMEHFENHTEPEPEAVLNSIFSARYVRPLDES